MHIHIYRHLPPTWPSEAMTLPWCWSPIVCSNHQKDAEILETLKISGKHNLYSIYHPGGTLFGIFLGFYKGEGLRIVLKWAWQEFADPKTKWWNNVEERNRVEKQPKTRIAEICGPYRRKFRSQTSNNMDTWKSRCGKRKRKRRKEKRREEKKEAQKRREEKKLREEKKSEERRCRCAKR